MAVAGDGDGSSGKQTIALKGAGDREAALATRHVLRLRAALMVERAGGESAAERARCEAAARPLVELAYNPLLRYCDRLAQQPGLRGYIEGADLAQDAWVKVIAHLRGANGERIRDDSHFVAMLNRAAVSRLLDLLPRARREVIAPDADAMEGRAAAYGVRASRTPEQETVLLRDEARLDLIASLFEDEAAFRRVNQQRKNARHPRQYQALVLYELGEHYQCETETKDEAAQENYGVAIAALFMDKWVSALGVPIALWEPVRAVAALPPDRNVEPTGGDTLDARLAAAVNVVCQTNVRDRKTLAVYRYEINQLVEIARAER